MNSSQAVCLICTDGIVGNLCEGNKCLKEMNECNREDKYNLECDAV